MQYKVVENFIQEGFYFILSKYTYIKALLTSQLKGLVYI